MCLLWYNAGTCFLIEEDWGNFNWDSLRRYSDDIKYILKDIYYTNFEPTMFSNSDEKDTSLFAIGGDKDHHMVSVL